MRDIVLLIVFTFFIFKVFRHPHYGVLIWSWISYMAPHRLTYGFAYSFPFAAVTAGITLISLVFSKEKIKIPVTAITVVWILFVLWTSITTLVAMVPEHAVFEWERSIKIQFMVGVTLLLINNKEKLNQLVWIIVLSIGFYGIKGGIFTLLTGGSWMVWGPQGTFIEGNNELALAMIMILPLLRYLQLQTENKWIKRGLIIAMGLCALSILASYSRGAFIAASAITLYLWLKSRKRVVLGIAMVVVILASLLFLPKGWFDRMGTIKTYEEDASAMGRINAWWFAYNIANERPIIGGGFHVFNRELFLAYAPEPEKFHDAHSIYFEVLGEHGYVGLMLFLLLYYLVLKNAKWIIKNTKDNINLLWARDLASMVQVGLIGYAVGGAFLGLAYFDLPYHFMAIIVILRIIVQKENNNSEDYNKENQNSNRPHVI
ncbi:MAG: putative O-glycosylation ligase, exosortase A system-associated [Candidatus Heimdallarchaeota archaeon]|nr:putative O-glycosylation ligase, exosortase A system-associated [Candidatus Heimdallarchaeota archaeon]